MLLLIEKNAEDGLISYFFVFHMVNKKISSVFS